MSYKTLSKNLITYFTENAFKEVWDKYIETKDINFLNSKCVRISNQYNFNITISYPGYKTTINKYNNLIYDYRFNFNGIPISHANIIIDLYNKSSQLQNTSELDKFINDVAKLGNDLDISNYKNLTSYTFSPPSKTLLDDTEWIHKKLNKNFLRKGNENWNYSIEELSCMIPLIVLQEDINYPMHKKNLQGRRMSFYRYIEAIFCGQSPNIISLGQIIERTLAHYQPKLFTELINYKAIIDLVDYENSSTS